MERAKHVIYASAPKSGGLGTQFWSKESCGIGIFCIEMQRGYDPTPAWGVFMITSTQKKMANLG